MEELKVDVKRSGLESCVATGPFESALETLNNSGYRPISLKEAVDLMHLERDTLIDDGTLKIPGDYFDRPGEYIEIQNNSFHPVITNDYWVREGIIFIPGEMPRIVRNSPLLESGALDNPKTDGGFYMTDNQLERALADSVIFPRPLSTANRFRLSGDEKFIEWALGEEHAGKYREVLERFEVSGSVHTLPVHYRFDSERPIVRQVRFGNFGNFFTDGPRDLIQDYHAIRGIRNI